MALHQRLMKPRSGERLEVYKNGELVVRGLVTHCTGQLISVTDKDMRVVNFNPDELDAAIARGEIRIKKLQQKGTAPFDRNL